MIHEIKVPAAGESVTEAYIGKWHKVSGDFVKKGDVLVELESQKATFELESEFQGLLNVITSEVGATVAVGDIIATIDDAAQPGATASKSAGAKKEPAVEAKTSPSVRRLMTENNVDASTVKASGKDGRILKEDVVSANKPANATPAYSTTAPAAKPAATAATTSSALLPVDISRGDRVERATRIRQQIAANLVNAQHAAAIRTTFNEVDMTQIMEYRAKNKDRFKAEHGVSLGMVGFFVVAASRALKEFPLVNAYFDGQNIIYHNYVDLSIAVSTDRGLVVPVVRNVDQMNILGFEKSLAELSQKARDGKLSIPEMTGGTFTISNGGVFGSLLSTPILNMPQTAILGLHKIQQRPMVVEGGKIEARPMMYMALSYDHRIIDGKDAVQFLVKIKEGVENIETLLK